jgi:predicted nucleic acid-binding protein
VRIFTDTSALLALLNADDRGHAAIAAAFVGIVQEEHQLVTTNCVLLQTVALLQRRFGVVAVRALQDEVLPLVVVRWVDEAMHGRAISALLAVNRRDVSLVDLISFETMRGLGLTHALTLDAHFGEQGFAVVPGA